LCAPTLITREAVATECQFNLYQLRNGGVFELIKVGSRPTKLKIVVLFELSIFISPILLTIRTPNMTFELSKTASF
jgi:hypothetical protein